MGFVRGSGEGHHAHLHGETEDHLFRMHPQSVRHRHDGWVVEQVGIRRKQREALVHDPVGPAELPHFAVPASIGIAAVLYRHGLDLGLLNQLGKLAGVHIADADHARASGSVDLFERLPYFPVFLAQAGEVVWTMQQIGIQPIGLQVFQ